MCGELLCAKAFCSVLGISRGTFRKWTKHIGDGGLVPKEKPRRAHPKRDQPARLHVRAWLRWCYDHWAADFAEVQDLVGRKPANDDGEEQVGDAEFLPVNAVVPQETVAMGVLSLEQLAKRPKVLPPGSKTSLHEVYAFQNKASETKASKSTFKREFHLWKKILLFQRVSSHARCTACARYAELRGKATTEEQKANVCMNHAQHIVDIFADRDTEAFFDRLGIESARPRFAQEAAPFKETGYEKWFELLNEASK